MIVRDLNGNTINWNLTGHIAKGRIKEKSSFHLGTRKVHGEQHYKFIPFYHSNRMNFLKAQKRDAEKKEWCEINGITHVVLPHFESLDKWRTLIIYDNKNS
jgi:hypothetical protein